MAEWPATAGQRQTLGGQVRGTGGQALGREDRWAAVGSALEGNESVTIAYSTTPHDHRSAFCRRVGHACMRVHGREWAGYQQKQWDPLLMRRGTLSGVPCESLAGHLACEVAGHTWPGLSIWWGP